jgi:hypothetical protein
MVRDSSRRSDIPRCDTTRLFSTRREHRKKPRYRADKVRKETGSRSLRITRGITEFKGIPYAAPPVGDLRWKPRSTLAGGRRACDT